MWIVISEGTGETAVPIITRCVRYEDINSMRIGEKRVAGDDRILTACSVGSSPGG